MWGAGVHWTPLRSRSTDRAGRRDPSSPTFSVDKLVYYCVFGRVKTPPYHIHSVRQTQNYQTEQYAELIFCSVDKTVYK